MTTKRTARPLPQVDEGALRASARAHPRDVLANDEPVVLESSAADPELPALQEFEVDEDGPRGSARKHPGLLWRAGRRRRRAFVRSLRRRRRLGHA